MQRMNATDSSHPPTLQAGSQLAPLTSDLNAGETGRSLHPRDALQSDARQIPSIAVCEHIAGNAKMIRKAMALQRDMAGAFDLTCDCEDGAAVGDERAHALTVARVLKEASHDADTWPGRVGVRIHDLGSPHWREDVAILFGEAAHLIAYVTLPKCSRVSDAARMADWIERCTRSAGRSKPVPLHVLIETHGALREADAIAALPNVETLDFGIMDFVSAHHAALDSDAMRSPMQFEHPTLVRAKTDLVSAALSNGVIPVHNVSRTLRDEQATFSDARRAREAFGFLRMWSIHPMQIRPIIEAMRPSYREVEDSARILLAAQQASWGPIADEDELHDRASYRHCWSVLERAHASRMPMPEAARQAFFD